MKFSLTLEMSISHCQFLSVDVSVDVSTIKRQHPINCPNRIVELVNGNVEIWSAKKRNIVAL